MFYVWGNVTLRSLRTATRNTAAKRKTMLRFAKPPLILRFGSYAVEIIITFALICYVLRYVFTFWEILRFGALQFQCLSLGLRIYALQHICSKSGNIGTEEHRYQGT